MENSEDTTDTSENIRLRRQEQDTTDRLIEMLLGISGNDPRFLERLEDDKQVVRRKYALPPEQMRDDHPREYYNLLKQIAEKSGLKIRPKEWDPEFFEENEDSEAKFEPDTMTIVFDLEEVDEKSLRKSLRKFEHELIHGLQTCKQPNMPIEVMEYEAHVANAPIEFMRKSSPNLRLRIFGAGLVGSVLNWYQRQGRTPEWDNPEWFLKNIDKID